MNRLRAAVSDASTADSIPDRVILSDGTLAKHNGQGSHAGGLYPDKVLADESSNVDNSAQVIYKYRTKLCRKHCTELCRGTRERKAP